MARDPICFAEVDETSATNEGLLSRYNGKSFFFCSTECKRRFDRDPGAFMNQPEWETTDDEPSEKYVG